METLQLIDVLKNGGVLAPIIVVVILLVKQNGKKDELIRDLSLRILAIVEAAKQVVESASKK